ncbi:MAG: GAF domain-containing protein, partial [candidate division NC10 bacterium]
LHARYQAGLEIQEPLKLQMLLDRLLQTSREVLQVDRLNILLADPEGRWLQAVATIGTEEPVEAIRIPIGPEGGGLAKAYLTQQVILWDGRAPVPEDLRLMPPYDGIKAFRSRVFANVPLVVQGRAIGVLGVDRKHSQRPFEPATLELLQLFAAQAAIAIENARLYADLEARIKALTRRTQELEALNTIGRAVSSSLAPAEVLDQALEATLSALDVEAGEIFLLEEARGEVVLARHRGLIPEAFSEVTCFKVGEGFPGRVVQTGEVLVTTDLARDARFLRKQVIEAGFCSFAAVPLKAKGQVVGTLNVASRRSDAFIGQRLHLLATIASGIGIAVANARLYEEKRTAAIQLEATVEERTRELKDANARLREAMRMVEDVSRHKSEFLANMSHELRTPLNAIIGFSELVGEQRVGPLTEKQARYVGHIHQAGKHLLQLISDILDLSKVEAGKFVLRPEPLPVAQTLEDILVIARGLANEKGQVLEAQVEPDLPSLQADPVRFK